MDDASSFIDDIVLLIRAKFYLPIPDADERPWFQGLSKAAKASLKKQSCENLKQARRQRFNPETPSSTLDALHNSIVQSGHNQNPSDDDDVENPHPNPKSEEKSVIYEELRQRLHGRIEELRLGRNTRPRNEARSDRQKRKREEIVEALEERKGEGQKDESLEAVAVAADITFGKVKVGGEDEKRKKKKVTKVRELEELEKAKRLEELEKAKRRGRSSPRGILGSLRMGVKVHDDPKLLKESIKKEKKRQKKHTEKWKDRVETRENARKERQRTRMDNIRERIHQKKMWKIEKREKKLMRPGFEGRKEGYINE